MITWTKEIRNEDLIDVMGFNCNYSNKIHNLVYSNFLYHIPAKVLTAYKGN